MIDRRAILAAAFIATCLAAVAVLPADTSQTRERPNFVVIFIDDMGYGDIEPFGSTLNKTPELNRMAAEGMKLTSFYVACPFCTPSRAALMTGCYPKRLGLASRVLFPKDPLGLNPSETTIAEILKQAGYVTGCFGKWHLGDQPQFLPTRHGFDVYYGIPYSNDMWPQNPRSRQWKYPPPPPLPILRDEKVIDTVENMDQQAQLCKLFTDEATAFIRKNKDRPFFVYLPHAFVHHPRKARDEFMAKAGSDEELDERKMQADDRYATRLRTRAQIEEVDWSVGRVLATLRELGLADNTLVIFTSDNGGARGCSNGPLRGGKGNEHEGGMREPTIAWWPGHVPAGQSCDEMVTAMDVLPTLAKLGGGQVPGDRIIDGKDIGPLLLGRADAKSPHEAFFYYRGTMLKAVRSGEWKLHADGRLYNLDKDIGEQNNVAKQNPKVVTRLEKLLDESRADLGREENCRPPGRVENPRYLLPLKGLKENR